MGARAQHKRARKASARATHTPVPSPDDLRRELNDILRLQTTEIVGQVLDPRRARENAVIRVQIDPVTWVKARRMDMTAMIFEGLMPMPILQSVQRLAKMKNMPQELRAEALADDEQDNKEVLDMLRTHAAAVVIEPKAVWPDDGNPDHMPADLFTMPQLIKIWTETALVPTVTPDVAWRFRERPAAVPAAPVSDGGEVREAPVDVDQDELIHQ